jgi:hypothetical protein
VLGLWEFLEMKMEWVEDLLAEAQKILEKPVICIHTDTLGKRPLEEICSILMHAFSKSADIRFFEAVCRLTWPLFTWFARRCIRKTGRNEDVESVTSSFYGLLCEGLQRPETDIPFNHPFRWCYCIIENLVKSVNPGVVQDTEEQYESDFDRFCPSLSEPWIRENGPSEENHVEEGIIEILISGDADLTPMESNVLSLYYGQNLSMKSVASNIGMSEQQIRDIFHNSRIKVLRELFKTKGPQFGTSQDEEERQ